MAILYKSNWTMLIHIVLMYFIIEIFHPHDAFVFYLFNQDVDKVKNLYVWFHLLLVKMKI